MTHIHHSSAHTQRMQYPDTEILGSVMPMVIRSFIENEVVDHRDLTTSQASSRLWHHLNVIGFATMQNVGFKSSWLLPHKLQRKAKKIKNYNVDYAPGSCMKL